MNLPFKDPIRHVSSVRRHIKTIDMNLHVYKYKTTISYNSLQKFTYVGSLR